MKQLFIFIISLFFLALNLQAQNIVLDLDFNDWDALESINDSSNDGASLDLLNMSVTDSDDYLYFRIETKQEIKLYETAYSNTSIRLYLDTDNNSNTGSPKYGLGSEIILDFGNREFNVYYPGVANWDRNINEIGFIVAPTTTGTEFEFCISKNYTPFNNIEIFNTDQIAFIFESTTGDLLPEVPSIYDLKNAENSFSIINPSKEINNAKLRLLSHNTLNEGWADSDRIIYFERIMKALKPDVITLNESDISESYAENLAQDWLGGDWYAKTFANTRDITISKYPILESYSLSSRMIAVLIDLPDQYYDTDYLSINLHAQCCSDDTGRQREADRFVAFIRDIKDGKYPEIENGTPFTISGDFNFVGFESQLNTLITGDIKNESTFGEDSPPDWDDTSIENSACLHTHTPFSHTWENQNGSWPPGKLDFIIHSDHVISEVKSFTFNTAELDQGTLIDLNVNLDDTGNASDHLPLVADLEFININSVSNQNLKTENIDVFNDKANGLLLLTQPYPKSLNYSLINRNGAIIVQGRFKSEKHTINTAALNTGIYYLITEQLENRNSQAVFINK